MASTIAKGLKATAESEPRLEVQQAINTEKRLVVSIEVGGWEK